MLQFGIIALLIVSALTSHAQQEPLWTWKDASGNIRTRADLDEILRKHRLWEVRDKSGVQAHLEDAVLDDADLRGADLTQVNLNRASLQHANLTGAWLHYAYLDHAILVNAKMIRTDLWLANLSGASLSGADMTDAKLRETELAGAWMPATTLNGTIFEPNSLPKLKGFAAARDLKLVTYQDSPDALVQLRKQLEDGGFRDQERKITYALKRREAELSWAKCRSRKLQDEDETRAILWSSDSVVANLASFILNNAFFDWTCQYGMSPGRPLMLGLLVWLICSALYFIILQHRGEDGLYRVYEPDFRKDAATDRRFDNLSISSVTRFRGRRRLLQFLRDEWLLLRASLFFSLMSAFNIGFRDINFGRWLRLLTRQEFDIKAVGWARVIAGWQSLISVYLIALWVLTYFGRPFG